jgi:hypothetical protein
MPHTQSGQSQLPLKDRLALHALRLKEAAQALRPGHERDAMVRRARQAETASHMNEWLSSPGLQPPR